MAVARMKDAVGRMVRMVQSRCVEGVRCDIETPGGHTIVTDEPPERGGKDEAAPPLMHLNAALASCQTVQIVNVAKAMRFRYGAINIEVSTTTDRVPGIEGNDPVMRYCAAALTIEIETDEPPNRLERLKALSEDRCPVGMLFADAGYSPAITWHVLPLKG